MLLSLGILCQDAKIHWHNIRSAIVFSCLIHSVQHQPIISCFLLNSRQLSVCFQPLYHSSLVKVNNKPNGYIQWSIFILFDPPQDLTVNRAPLKLIFHLTFWLPFLFWLLLLIVLCWLLVAPLPSTALSWAVRSSLCNTCCLGDLLLVPVLHAISVLKAAGPLSTFQPN